MSKGSFRNLLGGFLGGTIGVLLSWYSPIALPFGVLFGVVIGWWYREVGALLGEAHARGKKASNYLVGSTKYIAAMADRLTGMPPKVPGIFQSILSIAMSLFAFVASVPERFQRWLSEHQMNLASVLKLAAFLAAWFGIPTLFLLLLCSFGVGQRTREDLFLLAFIAVPLGWSVDFFRDGLGLLGGRAELRALGCFYREWEILGNHGPIYFFFSYLLKNLRYVVGVPLFLVLAVSWLIASMLLGMVGVYPLFFVAALARGLFRLTRCSGHWLCLGVTMVGTATSWYVYHRSFADPRILWMVALGTGFACGIATEIIHQLARAFFEHTRLGVFLANKKVEELVVGDEAFGEIGTKGNGYLNVMIFRCGMWWFGQNRFVRLLRAACLGTPILQPVRVI